MKFNVSSTSLCSRLQAISRVLSSKNSLPILECILFDLQDGILTLTASDSETTIKTVIETSESENGGKFAVGAKKIIDSLKEISEQPISFDVNTDTFEIVISYQNGKYKLIGQNGNNYPEPNNLEGDIKTITIENSVMLGGINKSLFATADDELRPVMNGIYFDIHTDNITFVASDGHKLVRDKYTSVFGDDNYSFILPKKPSLMLKNILPKDDGDVKITLNERNADIEFGNYKVICRLIDGRYPNYNSVIPTDNPFKATIDRLSLLSALRRVLVFASESNSLIKLRLDNNNLTVSSQDVDFSTSAEEHLMCDYSGNPMSIGFSGPFLIDILNNISSGDVVMELADPGRAGVIMPAEQGDDEDILMILMPMMLSE